MAETGRFKRPGVAEAAGDEEYSKRKRTGLRQTSINDALNINSLMDIMTILLVFLLVSITSDPWNVKQDQYLQLATSTVDRDPQDSLAIMITKQWLSVDAQNTIPISCTTAGGRQCRTDEDYARPDNRYFIDKAYKEDGLETAFLVPDLLKRLTDEIERAKEVHAGLERDEEFTGITTIICDRDIPFRVIAEVVHTAGNAQIDQLRFAVISEGRP